ncbi:MAG: transcriptional regulator [Rariglobus sp.]|nr:transcriptional regulator [Rariglobus sp.]
MPRNDPIQSITRSIRILFAVAGAEDGRSLEQIARLAGLKSATAYRMIRTLEQEGMLARTVSPLRFVLGSGVAELKQLDDERHLLTVASRVLIRTQARLPQGNFNLVERIGIESCERIAVNSTRPGVAIIRRTSLHDPYAKVSSLLFLAYADPLEQQAFFKQHPFERDGIAFWENSTRLHGFLSDISRDGCFRPRQAVPHQALQAGRQGNQRPALTGGFSTLATATAKRQRPGHPGRARKQGIGGRLGNGRRRVGDQNVIDGE